MMIRCRWVFFVAVLSLSGALLAAEEQDEKKAKAAEKKADKKAKAPEKAEPQEKLQRVGEIVGVLSYVEGSRKDLTVSIPLRHIARTEAGLQIRDLYEIKLVAADNLKVRVLRPPQDFDEKGRPRRYTSKELKALKGEGEDAKLRGYMADFDSLKQGQIVSVTVVKKQEAKKPSEKPKPKPKPKPKRKGKDEPAEEEEKEPLLAALVIILGEPGR